MDAFRYIDSGLQLVACPMLMSRMALSWAEALGVAKNPKTSDDWLCRSARRLCNVEPRAPLLEPPCYTDPFSSEASEGKSGIAIVSQAARALPFEKREAFAQRVAALLQSRTGRASDADVAAVADNPFIEIFPHCLRWDLGCYSGAGVLRQETYRPSNYAPLNQI